MIHDSIFIIKGNKNDEFIKKLQILVFDIFWRKNLLGSFIMQDKQFIIFSSKIVSLKNTVCPQLVSAFFYPMRASFVFISTLLDFKNILKAMKYRWPCHAWAILFYAQSRKIGILNYQFCMQLMYDKAKPLYWWAVN